MAKNLKLKIKNAQLAEALNLSQIKKPKKKEEKEEKDTGKVKPKAKVLPPKEPPAEKKPKAKIIKEKPEEITAPAKKKEEDISVVETTPKKQPPKEEIKPVKEPIQEKQTPEKKEEEKKAKPEEKKKEEKPKFAEEPAAKKPKSIKKPEKKVFDNRDRLGLRSEEETQTWRKARFFKKSKKEAKEHIPIVRPTSLKVKLPISLKDLASAMKLKASELISKLFLQGMIITLNDYLDDETVIQLLGQEFGCEINIDTTEEEKLKITDKSIQEEIKQADPKKLVSRPPIITFMGHVDHGKTSLIDAIRQSNITSQEAGAITQHIGAFTAKTPAGEEITILDTPGHEAFSEMRQRGATVTDIVILVIAGDEGIREQTIEAITQAQKANVPLIVAINKSDKANYDPDKVYRQLADHNFLPEAWGGHLITVNCSAHTKDGLPELLEMISLQAEILELKADPTARGRGTVLESEMHKGLGATSTVLVQNGTLNIQDAIVFGSSYGRIKTMHNQFNESVKKAGPSIPVKITGLSALAEAGDEFVVVSSEKEAKQLADARKEQQKRSIQGPSKSLESLMKKQEEKKVLHLIVRADVQGSLEAVINSLKKIHSKKVELNVVSAEVGEISESDLQIASASNAVILGFHTNIESHAEILNKELKVDVKIYDIIYHAIDDIKATMQSLLDRAEKEHDTGKVQVKTIFKSSHLGTIAGCQVTDGLVKRNSFVRLIRDEEIIWKGKIASLKREKEDVREVPKGLECGILLEGFSDIREGDQMEAYDLIYVEQEL